MRTPPQDPIAIFARLTGRVDDDGAALGPRREATRARIVSAAAAVFLAEGYRSARVDDIAAAADVTRPTLYAYFDSKERLLIAAMSEEALTQQAGGGALFDPPPPAEERLHDWLRGIVHCVARAPLTARVARDQDPEVMRILTEHPLAREALGHNPDLDKRRLFAGLFVEVFEGHIPSAEAHEIASLMRAVSHMAPAPCSKNRRASASRSIGWLTCWPRSSSKGCGTAGTERPALTALQPCFVGRLQPGPEALSDGVFCTPVEAIEQGFAPSGATL